MSANPNADDERPENVPDAKRARRQAAEIDEETRIGSSLGDDKGRKVLVKDDEQPTGAGGTVKVFKG